MDKQVVVLIAYHFPPENAVGALRPFRFYKYLSRLGYQCYVITASKQADDSDPNIIYVPDPFGSSRSRGLGWQVERAIRKLLLPGVTGTQWAFAGDRAGRALLSGQRATKTAIISTSPPLGVNLLAWLLARGEVLPWIADLRDPVANNAGDLDQNAFQKWLSRRIEWAILKTANLVVANTDAAAQELQNRHPSKSSIVRVIWNGFDPEARIFPASPPARSYKLFSHVGALYEGRDSTPLLESIGRLMAKGKLSPTRIKIRLVGSARLGTLPGREFLSEATTKGWLELSLEQVPFGEAKQITAMSDGFLLIQPNSRTQVPGKLFEYLQVGRPILAYIAEGSPIETILRKSGVAHTCAYPGSNLDDFDSAVESFFSLPGDARPPSPWFEQTFDGRLQVETLHQYIQALNDKEPEGTALRAGQKTSM